MKKQMIGCVVSLVCGAVCGDLCVTAERVDAAAAISWVESGPEASHPAFVKTALDARGRSRLLNGRTSGDGDAMVFGPWMSGCKRASFVVDLKSDFLVSKVTLWSAEEKGVRGCESFSVALSRDGTNFVHLARHVNPPEFSAAKKGKGVVCVPLECPLERPAVARYVKLVATQHPGRHQMVLGEVAVWGGRPPEGADFGELAPERRRPTVPLAVDGWSSGAATFDWSGFAAEADVLKWTLYAADREFADVHAAGVTRIAELERGTTSYTACPLRPGVTRYYAVSATYADGECQTVKSIAHAPVGPLEVRRFRDMLGFNFFWGGGGANEKASKAYYDVAADFLTDIGIRRIRWWMTPEWAVRDQYLNRCIELSGWTGEKGVAGKYGIYLHGIGNEPELGSRTPAESVEMCRKVCEDWKGLGSDHKFYGPVVNIDTRGFNYLKKFVENGGAQYVDAIDLHTYLGFSSEFVYPRGYPGGAPEAIVGRVHEIRMWLKAKGVDKPFTCSEWGYPDSKTANPHMRDPTPLRKAQFLVRGCILHHALDFRRLYAYSFYDEGTDPDCPEHLYGVVSRDCQKKPAYFALKNMVATIGDAKIESEMSGLGDGDFGFVFRNTSGPGFVTVAWNGARERLGHFRAASASVRIVSLFGVTRTAVPEADGTFPVQFGASPVYLVAGSPVEAVRIDEMAEAGDLMNERNK